MKMLRWDIVEGGVSPRVGYCQGWGIVKCWGKIKVGYRRVGVLSRVGYHQGGVL